MTDDTSSGLRAIVSPLRGLVHFQRLQRVAQTHQIVTYRVINDLAADDDHDAAQNLGVDQRAVADLLAGDTFGAFLLQRQFVLLERVEETFGVGLGHPLHRLGLTLLTLFAVLILILLLLLLLVLIAFLILLLLLLLIILR